MSKRLSVLSSICIAALAATACGGGDSGLLPANLAPTAGTGSAISTGTAAPAPAPGSTSPSSPTPIIPGVTAPTPNPNPNPTPTPNPAPATNDTNLSGSVVKGPVGNATVTAKKPDGTACGTTATNTVGQYALTTACKGDVIIEVTGGSYLDEATNTTKRLTEPMRVVVNAAGANVTGVVTPLTTMAYSLAFSSSSAASVAAFNAQMAKTATQFGLSNVNLATVLPIVTGTSNAYGNALKAISQYLNDNRTATLANFTAPALTTQAALDAFSLAYNSAFFKINGTASNVTFNSNGFTITGTGGGGGSGTCGITAQGSVTSSGFTVPINVDFCASGIAGGSCDVGNLSLNQALAAQGGIAKGVNLNYTYSPACKAGAIQINLN